MLGIEVGASLLTLQGLRASEGRVKLVRYSGRRFSAVPSLQPSLARSSPISPPQPGFLRFAQQVLPNNVCNRLARRDKCVGLERFGVPGLRVCECEVQAHWVELDSEVLR